MKKGIIIASIAMTLASGLQAVTLEELEVRLNAGEAMLNSMSTQITTLETRLNAGEAMLNSTSTQITTLETQIAELQTFHNIRHISIDENTTTQSLKDKLGSLNYQSGEFLYLTTDSSQTAELCTSHPKAADWVNDLPAEGGGYTWWGYDYTDTWMTIPSEPTWTPVYRINAQSSAQHGQFYLSLLNNLSAGAEFNARASEIGTSIDTYQAWSGANSITLKVAATREEACGF